MRTRAVESVMVESSGVLLLLELERLLDRQQLQLESLHGVGEVVRLGCGDGRWGLWGSPTTAIVTDAWCIGGRHRHGRRLMLLLLLLGYRTRAYRRRCRICGGWWRDRCGRVTDCGRDLGRNRIIVVGPWNLNFSWHRADAVCVADFGPVTRPSHTRPCLGEATETDHGAG